MATFDKAKLSADTPSYDLVDHVNGSIAKVRGIVRDTIEIDDKDLPSLIFSNSECFLQAHVRRALMFLDGGLHALEGGFGLLTIASARAIYESAACIHDYCNELMKHFDADDLDAAHRLVHERTFAFRYELNKINDETYDFTAVNILKQIDKFSKTLPYVRRVYEQLSEAVHPNASGTSLYFGIDRENGVARFKSDDDKERLYSLLFESACLFSFIYSDIIGILCSRIGTLERDLQNRIDDYERRKAAGLTKQSSK